MCVLGRYIKNYSIGKYFCYNNFTSRDKTCDSLCCPADFLGGTFL